MKPSTSADIPPGFTVDADDLVYPFRPARFGCSKGHIIKGHLPGMHQTTLCDTKPGTPTRAAGQVTCADCLVAYLNTLA